VRNQPTIINAPTFPNGMFTPDGGNSLTAAIASEFTTELLVSKQHAHQKLKRKVHQGNPALSIAQNSKGWMDMAGNDILISGNKYDSKSGTRLKAMDSKIIDYGYTSITSSQANFDAFVNRLQRVYRYLVNLQAAQGGGEWDGVLVMRKDLWEVLSERWPIAQYQRMLAQVAAYTNLRANVDVRQLSDAMYTMRQARQLPLDGDVLQIVLDDGMNEEGDEDSASIGPNEFASAVEFVPLRSLGRPMTYITPVRWDAQTITQVMNFGSGMARSSHFVSDGGTILWTMSANRGCIEFDWWISGFYCMHTPQWAARIDKIKYSVDYHLPDSYSDSSYFVGGEGRRVNSSIGYYDEDGTLTKLPF
jgi:hypothetical protein